MSDAATARTISPDPFLLDWKAVERRVPLLALEEFSRYSGIRLKDLVEVVIPPRTLKHRKQRKEPLSLEESDRLATVARMFQLAVRVFRDSADGIEWLTTPKDRFDGKTPLAVLRTATGEHAVQEFLSQIDEGMFA